MIRVRADESKILSHYLVRALQTPDARSFIINNASGSAGSMPKINQKIVQAIPIPLPPLDDQREIIAALETESSMVESNRKLIDIFDQKIQAKLAEVWGEKAGGLTEVNPERGGSND